MQTVMLCVRVIRQIAPIPAIAFALALPAMADTPPPANAMPLSEIIAQFEATGDLHYFDEIEWDDDGYWEIEYRRTDGARVKIRIDPVTGQAR